MATTIKKAAYFCIHFTLVGYDGSQTYYTKEEFKNARLNLLNEVLRLQNLENEGTYPERISWYEEDFKFQNMLETALNLEQITDLNLVKAFADSNQLYIEFSKAFIQKYIKKLGKATLNVQGKKACE